MDGGNEENHKRISEDSEVNLCSLEYGVLTTLSWNDK